MKRFSFFILAVGCALASCQTQPQATSKEPSLARAEYAHFFRMSETPSYTQLQILNPWDTTQTLGKYVLLSSLDQQINLDPSWERIKIPIESAITSNALQCENIIRMGGLKRIKGVLEGKYIQNTQLKQRLNQNLVQDLGETLQGSREHLIALHADIIFSTPYQSQQQNPVKGIQSSFIPYVDYMETHPLGQVEWVKVIGHLLGKGEQADSLFQATEKAYNSLKAQVSQIERRPSVFTEIKTGNSWFVAGGKSYLAHMLNDAAGNYIFKGLDQSGSTPMNEEQVYHQAGDAAIWLIKYHHPKTITRQELIRLDPIYGEFEAFKQNKTYICNTSIKPYYEEISLYPERLLADLIAIFHPEILPQHQPHYFELMQEGN